MKSQEARCTDPVLLQLRGALFADPPFYTPAPPDITPEPLAPAEAAQQPLPPTEAVQQLLSHAGTTLQLGPRAEATQQLGLPTPQQLGLPAEHVQQPTPSRRRPRHARVASWTTAVAAVGLLALGAAAATQMPSSEPSPAPELADPPADALAGASMPPGMGAKAVVPPAPEPAATEMPRAAEMPQSNPTARAPNVLAAAPRATTPLLPVAAAPATPAAPAVSAPVSGSLEALAAPRPFSREGAAVAVSSAARGAAGCVAADDPRTTMPVRVVFAPSGRVTSASVQGGPFLGTQAGSCIASALRSARIGAFEGDTTAVNMTVRIR